jgi:anti-sigma B factor antagonist
VEFSSRQFADVIVATPFGRIDHTNAETLKQSLAPLVGKPGTDNRALLLDFSRVEYISSVGLRVLMMAAKQARECGARIAVAALQPVVGEIFEISRFNHVLDIHPSVREAIAKLSAPALAAYDAAAPRG